MAPTEAPWGPGKPPFIIAEIGLTHEGSLGNSLAFIDACASVGASAVKFQCHDGDENDQFREGFDWPQDVCRQAYWSRTAFDLYEWDRLSIHAEKRGILFGCTPFSVDAVRTIARMSGFIKIARQHAGGAIHRAAADTGKDVLFTGFGGLGLNQFNPAEHIGISDHSASIGPSIDAFKRGAQVCEVHVCFDRRQFGPDVQYSVTIDELGELIKAVR